VQLPQKEEVKYFGDWKRSKMSLLEVEAEPQSCIPYVQIGLIIALLRDV
jgi:hypothetical protein